MRFWPLNLLNFKLIQSLPCKVWQFLQRIFYRAGLTVGRYVFLAKSTTDSSREVTTVYPIEHPLKRQTMDR